MNLGQNMRTPTGSGTVDVRLEDGTLYADNLRHHFNRGTEIRAMAAIGQIARSPRARSTARRSASPAR